MTIDRVDTERRFDYGAQPSALLIASGDGAAAGAATLTMAGFRVIGPIGWGAAPARIAEQAAVNVVLIEGVEASEAAIAPVFDAADLLARDGVHVVVTIAGDAIDLVGARLSLARCEVLCAPSTAERLGAVLRAQVAQGAPMLHDSGRDGEAVRLQRLNEEVARIAETLARLTRGDGGTLALTAAPPPRRDAVSDRAIGFRAQPADTAPFSAPDIRQAIRVRRLRDQFFPDGLFEDPAWDMLLDLFAADLERARVSVSSLCIAAAVAPTTALRWIGRMTETGLFVREADPFDRRRAFMALSPQARDGMQAYFAALRRIGATLA